MVRAFLVVIEVLVLGRKTFPVEVAIIGIAHNTRQNDAVLAHKTDHGHAGVGHIEMGGKDRIRNIQKAA